MTDSFHPTRWTLVLRARGEHCSGLSGSDVEAFRHCEIALAGVKSPKAAGSVKFRGCDEQNVIAAVAELDRSCGRYGFSHLKDGIRVNLTELEESPLFVQFVIIERGLHLLRCEEIAEYECSQCICELEIIEMMDLQWQRGTGKRTSGGFAVNILSVKRKQETGVSEVHEDFEGLVASPHILVKPLKFRHRQGSGRLAGPVPESGACRPIDLPLRMVDPGGRLALDEHVFPVLHPSDDGGKLVFQIVQGDGFHVNTMACRAQAVKR